MFPLPRSASFCFTDFYLLLLLTTFPFAFTALNPKSSENCILCNIFRPYERHYIMKSLFL